MTRALYVTIRDALLFLFVISLADGVTILGDTVFSRLVVALIFGILMMLLPTILRFFKIRVKIPALTILALLVSSVFCFVLYSGIGGFAEFSGSIINWGLGPTSIMRLDTMGTFLFVAIGSAISAVILEILSEAN